MSDKESTYIIPNRFKDPFSFEEIINNYDNIVNNNRIIDMSRVSFIEPYSMLSFLLLGRLFLRSRGDKIKLINIPLNIHQYLMRMDFFKAQVFETTDTLSEKMLLKRSSFSKRVIEIIEIPNKERESVKVISQIIEKFRKKASNILKHWLTENAVDYFVTVISELCQNIFEHSLDSGFLSIQTYSAGNENILRLVISDSGIGIIKSFEKNEKIKYETSAQLLEMALTTPISSKREFGYGLCQVNSIIEKMKGNIFIRSENASLSVVYNQKAGHGSYLFHKNDLSYFNGTQISISLTA